MKGKFRKESIIQIKDLEYFQKLVQKLNLVPLTYDFSLKKYLKIILFENFQIEDTVDISKDEFILYE